MRNNSHLKATVQKLVFQLFLSLLLTFKPTIAVANTDGLRDYSIKAGNVDRHYKLFSPPFEATDKKKPLVIFMHGAGGSSKSALRETKLDQTAEEQGFFLAVPDGTRRDPSAPADLKINPQTWNDGSNRFDSEKSKVDDVGFVRQMIADICANNNINKDRIYVCGFSNGASMTFRLGDELSDTLAAIAPVAGACWLEPSHPEAMPMFYITGTDDSFNPLNGGIPQPWINKQLNRSKVSGKPKPPVAESIQKWQRKNLTTSAGEVVSKTNDLSIVRYGKESSSSEIQLCFINGIGHTWPGGNSLLPEFIVGKTTNNVKANDLIWAFFQRHSLENERELQKRK
jgi:polyhydroxybutyrate depolymerase